MGISSVDVRTPEKRKILLDLYCEKKFFFFGY